MKTTRLAIAAILLCTAGAARADNETIVAVFTKNQTNPFFNNVRVGAENAAKQLGAKIIQYVPTKPDSIPEQMSQVEDVIVKKPDAIVFTPVDYKALIPGVEKMNAAGIPVINVTDHMAGGTIVSFVGIDDYKVGRATAEALMKALGGKGNVVIIEGVKGSLSNQDRTRGLTDVTKSYPNVKLLATQAGNFQRLNALQVMENLMQSFPQIDGVMAANDAMAIGAIEALDELRRPARAAFLDVQRGHFVDEQSRAFRHPAHEPDERREARERLRRPDDVTHQRSHVPTGAVARRGPVVAVQVAQQSEHPLVFRGGQAHRGRPPDAGRRAGDQRDLALEAPFHDVPS